MHYLAYKMEFNIKKTLAALSAVVVSFTVLSVSLAVASGERVVTEPRSLVALGIALISAGLVTRKLLQKVVIQKDRRTSDDVSMTTEPPRDHHAQSVVASDKMIA